jgi:hypothetical protein
MEEMINIINSKQSQTSEIDSQFVRAIQIEFLLRSLTFIDENEDSLFKPESIQIRREG